jgi:hypothetical protein
MRVEGLISGCCGLRACGGGVDPCVDLGPAWPEDAGADQFWSGQWLTAPFGGVIPL